MITKKKNYQKWLIILFELNEWLINSIIYNKNPYIWIKIIIKKIAFKNSE